LIGALVSPIRLDSICKFLFHGNFGFALGKERGQDLEQREKLSLVSVFIDWKKNPIWCLTFRWKSFEQYVITAAAFVKKNGLSEFFREREREREIWPLLFKGCRLRN
jgi:hypothetical protein